MFPQYLCLNVFDCVGRLHVQLDAFFSPTFHKNMHNELYLKISIYAYESDTALCQSIDKATRNVPGLLIVAVVVVS